MYHSALSAIEKGLLCDCGIFRGSLLPALLCCVLLGGCRRTKFSSLHIFIVSMTSPGTGDLGTWRGNVNFELAERNDNTSGSARAHPHNNTLSRMTTLPRWLLEIIYSPRYREMLRTWEQTRAVVPFLETTCQATAGWVPSSHIIMMSRMLNLEPRMVVCQYKSGTEKYSQFEHWMCSLGFIENIFWMAYLD